MSWFRVCLRGSRSKESEPSPRANSATPKPERSGRYLTECSNEDVRLASSASCEAVARLRPLLAGLGHEGARVGLSRLAACAEVVARQAAAGMVGLLGSAEVPGDIGGGLQLVSLASAGPAAACLPPGEVLTLPGSDSCSQSSRSTTDAATWGRWKEAAAACGGQDLVATRRSGSSRPAALALPPWQAPPGTAGGASQLAQHSPGDGELELVLQSDADWQRVLCALRAACPPDDPSTRTAGSSPWHVLLVPLQLGPQLVGALLLALPGGDEGRRGGAPPSPLHRALLETPGALHEVAACVAECCLAPVLPAVQQVCSAAVHVASCSSVPQLSAALCSALAAPLASELFVELGARLALLPHRDAAKGLLYEDLRCQQSYKNLMSQPEMATCHIVGASPLRPLKCSGDVYGGGGACVARPEAKRAGGLSSAVRDLFADTHSAGGGKTALNSRPPSDAAGSTGPERASKASPARAFRGQLSEKSLDLTPNPAGKAVYLPLAGTLAATLLSEAYKAAPAASSIASTPQPPGAAARPSLPRLRVAATAVPSVPSLLQDPSQPSADLVTVLARHGGSTLPGACPGTGTAACLLALACVWAPDCPTQAASQITAPHSSAQAEGAQRDDGDAHPALVLYLSSPTPLPRPLLAAAHGLALDVMQILAPAALRALSGPAAPEWGCLRVLATQGPAGLLGPGGGSCKGASPLSHLIASRWSASRGPNTGQLPYTAELPTSAAGLHAGAPNPRRASIGDVHGHADLIRRTSRFSNRSFTSEAPRAKTPVPMLPSSANLLAKLTASSEAVGAGSRAAASSGRLAMLVPLATPEHETLPLDEGFVDISPFARTCQVEGSPLEALAWAAGAAGPLTPEEAALALALVSTTPLEDDEDGGEGLRQAQMGLMLSTFAAELDGARQAAAPSGGLHAAEDVEALRLQHAIGTGAHSVVALAKLHAMRVAVKIILPPEGDEEAEGGQEEEEEDEEGEEADAREGTATRPRLTSRGQRQRRRALLRGVRELAVMSSVSHPNIVQVYSYCTRVLVPDLPSRDGKPLESLQVVPEGEPAPEPLCTVLIMEYCDMGSLADAVDCGLFRKASALAAAALGRDRARPATASGSHPIPPVITSSTGEPGPAQVQVGPAQAPALRSGGSRLGRMLGSGASAGVMALDSGSASMHAVYLTLLEVALALRHLHSLSLVHCDLKPANVLLRSSTSDPRGFTTKLTDFGFVSLLERAQSTGGGDAGEERDSSAGSAVADAHGGRRRLLRFPDRLGTVTHMAPECFLKGAPLDSSIDVYAFGILMWELYTGRAPYAEHAASGFRRVPPAVVRNGLRPHFPVDTPLHYQAVAKACWSTHPQQRPTAAALVRRIQALLDACGGGAGGEAVASSRRV